MADSDADLFAESAALAPVRAPRASAEFFSAVRSGCTTHAPEIHAPRTGAGIFSEFFAAIGARSAGPRVSSVWPLSPAVESSGGGSGGAGRGRRSRGRS